MTEREKTDAPEDVKAEAAAPEGADTAAAPSSAEAPPADAPAADADRLAALEADNAKLKDQLMRAVAETENVRRRGQRDREDASKYAVTAFAKDLLPVADNLRRALDAVPADQRGAEAVKNLLAGVEMTEKELLSVLERHGVQKIDPTGQPFDPNFHEAFAQVENTGQAAGTVVQTYQAGYTIAGRLLRPAMVTVAAGESRRVDTTV
ncbi:MAG TPA: nucleotide exchange factor GrpE [Alphaproteobacteria bacterium]|nr:nucleotide exchange factor GrpE [Alphaproteobacteria bacterium]